MAEKVDLLIKLLNVCPKCISGYIHPHKFSYERSSGAACYPPINTTVFDTSSVSVRVSCTNGECDNSVTYSNPYYKPPIVREKDRSSSEENKFDLFG